MSKIVVCILCTCLTYCFAYGGFAKNNVCISKKHVCVLCLRQTYCFAHHTYVFAQCVFAVNILSVSSILVCILCVLQKRACFTVRMILFCIWLASFLQTLPKMCLSINVKHILRSICYQIVFSKHSRA